MKKLGSKEHQSRSQSEYTAQPVSASGSFTAASKSIITLRGERKEVGNSKERHDAQPGGVCWSWDLRRPKTWEEAEEEGVEPPGVGAVWAGVLEGTEYANMQEVGQIQMEMRGEGGAASWLF